MYGGQWKKEPTFMSVGWTMGGYDMGGSFIVIENVSIKELTVDGMYHECKIREKKSSDHGYLFRYLKNGKLFEVKFDEDLISWWHDSDRDDSGRMYLYIYSLKLNPRNNDSLVGNLFNSTKPKKSRILRHRGPKNNSTRKTRKKNRRPDNEISEEEEQSRRDDIFWDILGEEGFDSQVVGNEVYEQLVEFHGGSVSKSIGSTDNDKGEEVEEELDHIPQAGTQGGSQVSEVVHPDNPIEDAIPASEVDDVPLSGADGAPEVELDIDHLEPEEGYHSDQSDDDTEGEHEDNPAANEIEPLSVEELTRCVAFKGTGEKYDELYEDEASRVQPKKFGGPYSELYQGLRWGTIYEARRHLRRFGIFWSFEINFHKNDSHRITEKCKNDSKCESKVCAGRQKDGHTIKVRSYVAKHTCDNPQRDGNSMVDCR
ncbi:hypothetical protein C5167_044752 [Papaver somniferum]|nr:hypothetical protein C5167_044752 [Papaver somniferum]